MRWRFTYPDGAPGADAASLAVAPERAPAGVGDAAEDWITVEGALPAGVPAALTGCPCAGDAAGGDGAAWGRRLFCPRCGRLNDGGGAWSHHPALRGLLPRAAWDDALVGRTGLPIADAPLMSVGGGLGSFALVDLLRIAGVPADRLRVVGPGQSPAALFRALCEASGIDDTTRLRSESSACIDNPWGWPGYAAREAVAEGSLRALWRVLAEPLLAEPYTPRAGQVYRGIAREGERIGWPAMASRGWARLVRRRAEGGYFVLEEEAHGALRLWRCQHVHLAVGHAGVRLSPALEAWRQATGDSARTVHVYERHEQLYGHLRQWGGTVVVQGGGIAASHEVADLARLARRARRGGRVDGPPVRIVHVIHPSSPEGTADGSPFDIQYSPDQGPRYQHYSWPKAMFGGALAARFAQGDEGERADLARHLGRGSTAARREWQDLLAAGRREGWYTAVRGEISSLERASLDGEREGLRVAIAATGRVAADWAIDVTGRIDADGVIDATGLQNHAGVSPVVADLLACDTATLNALGGLSVDEAFRVRGGESGDGRLYASGALAAGGPIAPVDSFWGLQRAALDICADLAAGGWCPALTTRRSVAAWRRWLRDRDP